MKRTRIVLILCLLVWLPVGPVSGETKRQVNENDPQTLTNKTLTAPAVTNPTITGTVAGSPTITSPSITGTVGGSGTYTMPNLTGATLSATKTFDTNWESAEKYVDLQQAVTQLGTTVTTLVISQPKPITANITFPTTITLQFVSPGKLTCTTAGVLITVDGPVNAGFSKIFDLSGGCKVTSTRGSTFPPQWWGAGGDGIANDTVPMQAMLDVYSGQGKTGSAILPCGTYLISSTLTYTGDSANSFSFQGACGSPGRGPAGSVIKWIGAVGGTMIETKGANQLLVRNLALDGNGLAKWGFSNLSNAAVGGAGSAGITYENVVAGGFVGTNSACVRLGDSSFQVSEVKFQNITCVGYGAAGTTYYGIWTQSGNVKNFWIFGGNFLGLRYGITHGDPSLPSGGSGYLTIVGTQFAQQTIADVYEGGGNALLLSGCGSEGSAMLVNTVTSNPVTETIQSCYFDSATGSDDVVIRATGGQLSLIGNQLYNRRTGTSLPRIESPNVASVGTGAPRTSVTSMNNYYHQASGYLPLYDAGGDSILRSNNGTFIGKPARVWSSGDMGGNLETGSVTPLTTVFGPAPTIQQLRMGSALIDPMTTGVTANAEAQLNRVLFKVTIAKDAWTAASTTQDMTIYDIPAKARLVSIIADTTQAYAGLAGTIALTAGFTAGGNEYLVSHDVKSATITRGLADADLGASINRANAIQGGHIQSWTAAGALSIRLTSGAGNLGNGTVTNLTTGSTTFYLTYELFP